MATTVSANLQINANAIESFAAADVPSIGQALNLAYAGFNQAIALDADSTPPITKAYAEKLTSTQTLDLTALTKTIGAVVDATGLKLQVLIVVNLSTTNTVTVSDGDANAYQCWGGQTNVIQAGGVAAFFFNDKLGDVGAAAKNLKFTATAGQTYGVLMLLG